MGTNDKPRAFMVRFAEVEGTREEWTRVVAVSAENAACWFAGEFANVDRRSAKVEVCDAGDTVERFSVAVAPREWRVVPSL